MITMYVHWYGLNIYIASYYILINFWACKYCILKPEYEMVSEWDRLDADGEKKCHDNSPLCLKWFFGIKTGLSSNA